MVQREMRAPFILALVVLFVGLTAFTQAWAENAGWPKRMIYAGSRAGSGAYAVGVGISALVTKVAFTAKVLTFSLFLAMG